MEKMLGVMIDCSRNAVMRLDKVKQYANIIKKMGYNTLMLYTEDTYEIESQPYFGHLRGRYTKEELKEINGYCNSIGIELVPCIQTLAHLEAMFKWKPLYSDINDCDDILFIGEEKTYQLIDEMFKTITECFSSKNIHIGMDEAYMVGSGRYQSKHGYCKRFDIINEHLHKVCELAEKYSLKPMIWSDMFCKLAADQSGTGNQYDKVDETKILEKAAIPENVSLVYWDYYNLEREHYDIMIKRNKLFRRPVIFAGGAWTWNGFAPDNDFSIRTTEAAVDACNANQIDGMIFTIWGDDGAECSVFSVLPSLMYAAEKAKGNNDIDSIKKKFKEIVDVEFDSFMLLDKLDKPGNKHEKEPAVSKYLLYNDPFMGIRDSKCSNEDNVYFEKLAREIRKIPEKGEFSYVFDYLEKLADVLAIKASLGIRTRETYLQNNRDEIKNIIEDYAETLQRLEVFYETYRERWYLENKPHGFDVMDLRLGGVIRRMQNCKDRLEKYVNEEIQNIPELEEPVLSENNGFPHWWRCISANVLWHGLE